MNIRIELTGQKFGHLTVIELCPRTHPEDKTKWICECACGRRLIVRSDNLRKGRSTQCSWCRGNVGRKSTFIEGDGEHGVV